MKLTLKLALPTAQISREQGAFFQILGERTRLSIEPVPILTHAGLCAAIEENAVQMLWAPPLVALDLWEWGSADPLAAVVRGGWTSYPAVLVARRDTEDKLETMLGRRVAWVSRLSAAGYVVPARFLESEGLGGVACFREQQFVHTHPGVLHAVLQGKADVGATYGRRLRASNVVELSPEVEGLRILATVGFVPNEVIMANRSVSELERLSLGEAFRRMTLRELELLGPHLGVDRFTLNVQHHLEPLLRLTRRARSSAPPPEAAGNASVWMDARPW